MLVWLIHWRNSRISPARMCRRNMAYGSFWSCVICVAIISIESAYNLSSFNTLRSVWACHCFDIEIFSASSSSLLLVRSCPIKQSNNCFIRTPFSLIFRCKWHRKYSVTMFINMLALIKWIQCDISNEKKFTAPTVWCSCCNCWLSTPFQVLCLANEQTMSKDEAELFRNESKNS